MSDRDAESPAAPEPAVREAGVASQVGLLTVRLIHRALRSPAVTLPNLLISVFFLLVYDGLLGGSAQVGRLVGGNYTNFILPVIIVSAAVSGGSAGLILVEDLESGYFRRLLAMPLSRLAIVAAPMILGALQVAVQAVLVIVLGILLGASPATGVGGLVVLVGYALLWGLGFAGYSVATGLRTGNAQAAQAATFLFFPLVFIAPTFLPLDQLAPALRAVAHFNPTTYVLEGMRSLLIDGWQTGPLLRALAAGGGFALLTLTAALAVARRATSRA